ncbi:MAG TPA: M1 family metallopeptidase [Thermoanaerobaculia bacterium]|nr:M1 family metallopeptidase [Thermoanaerobaculia bacterium]
MKQLRTLALLAVAAVLAAPSARALDAPRKVVDYDIRVSLDPAAKMLDGRETLKWTNPSDVPVSELKFHLYWNAFRNNQSTFFRESGGQLRGDRADLADGWGFIDVTAMTWDGQDLTKGFRFESPDDGNPDDRTVLSVALPRPAAPGETVSLDIAWKAKAPKVFARSGYVRDFYFVGQWYPKIGVFEPAGTRRRSAPGWNCHQYHANSEFYADWGDYRVEITLPEKFVVGSAGAKVAETTANGKKTLTFVQDRIHDFAWTADPRYVVKESVFDPAKDVPKEEIERASRLLGRTPDELMKGFHPVKLFFYMQPDHVSQWTRYEDAQKWALAWFGLWAFPYPYAQVSVVDPPEDGMGAGGMEYQTIYTAGTWKRLGRWPFKGLRAAEGVVVHEFGHGYWYGLLASNEFEESWMDEGINSFTEAVMMDRRYRYVLEAPFGVGISDENSKRTIVSAPDFDPIVTKAWQYSTSGSYGRNSYPRAATVVEQIRRLAGEAPFWRAFRRYAERWRFDHPTSEDFLDEMRPLGLPHFEEFARKTFYGTDDVDFRVLRADSARRDPLTGFDDAEKPVNFEPGKKKAKEPKERDDKRPWETVVVVGRGGGLALPVDVLLRFENGETWRTTWDGRTKWLRLKTTYASKLSQVVVDPDGKIVLDRDPFNNVRNVGRVKGPSAAAKVRAYAMHFVEILLSSFWSLP